MPLDLRQVSFAIVAALVLLGATPSPRPMGGANAAKALEGCPGKPLFNGVTRLLIDAPKAGNDGFYWTAVTVRNGTSSPLTLTQMGITPGSFQLAFGDDDVRPAAYFSAMTGASYIGLPGDAIQPGMGMKFQVAPGSRGGTAPTKVIVLVDKKAAKGVHFAVRDPSFRIRTNCSATPSPAPSGT